MSESFPLLMCFFLQPAGLFWDAAPKTYMGKMRGKTEPRKGKRRTREEEEEEGCRGTGAENFSVCWSSKKTVLCRKQTQASGAEVGQMGAGRKRGKHEETFAGEWELVKNPSCFSKNRKTWMLFLPGLLTDSLLIVLKGARTKGRPAVDLHNSNAQIFLMWFCEHCKKQTLQVLSARPLPRTQTGQLAAWKYWSLLMWFLFIYKRILLQGGLQQGYKPHDFKGDFY